MNTLISLYLMYVAQNRGKKNNQFQIAKSGTYKCQRLFVTLDDVKGHSIKRCRLPSVPHALIYVVRVNHRRFEKWR